MSVGNPIIRDDRRQDITATNGQTVFGPLNFKIYDTIDLRVRLPDPDTGRYETLTISFSIGLSNPPNFATVTFAAPWAGGEQLRFEGARLQERTTDVTLGGVMRSAPMENELDVESTVLQELRRDADDNDAAITDLAEGAENLQDQIEAEVAARALADEILRDLIASGQSPGG